MADQKKENPDENPEASASGSGPAESVSEDMILADIDQILVEEDPNFLKQIEKIKIETTHIEMSIMDQALGMQQNGLNSSVLDYLKKPFEIKANTKDVLLFWFVIVVAVTIFKFTWNFKYNYLHQDLFLRSFSEIAGPIQEFNPNVREEIEPFYDNSRFSKNLLTLPRLNVNLKRSANSGDNPMGAFELTIEGLSSDAIIEIKDREAEFRDLLARFTEDKNYDELATAQGKSELCEKMRDIINANLTVGQVRRVLIKNFLMKP